MNWKERILLILLASVNFTHILDFMVMMPLGNFLMPYFNITPGQFSVIVASYSISAAVSGFAAAFYVDGYDRKKVLLFGYIGFTIGTLCCGIAPSYLLLLLARITAGLFGGLIGAQVLSIVADSFPYEKRGQAMGILFSAFSLASIVGVPSALYLAGWLGWHSPFLSIGGLGIFITVLLMRYLPSMSSHIHGQRVKPIVMLKNVMTSRTQLVALGLSAALMLGHFLIIPFLNPYMEFNVGFTDTQRNMIYMVGGIATFITSPLIGKMADKYGKHNTFMFFALISLIPIFLITNMPAIKYYYVLIVTGIWFVLSTGRGIPAQAIISNVVPAEQRGSFMSFNGSIQQLFSGIASLIAGMIVISKPDHTIVHYSWVGYLSIIIVLFSVFIAKKLRGYEQ